MNDSNNNENNLKNNNIVDKFDEEKIQVVE